MCAELVKGCRAIEIVEELSRFVQRATNRISDGGAHRRWTESRRNRGLGCLAFLLQEVQKRRDKFYKRRILGFYEVGNRGFDEVVELLSGLVLAHSLPYTAALIEVRGSQRRGIVDEFDANRVVVNSI